MATWLTHLRVSERLINKIKISDNSLFFAGSIAPDTNISPDISHWCVNGDKTTCDVTEFYRKYILNSADSSDFDFYLGYYVHLQTDVMWQQKIKPIKVFDPATIKIIKESWKSVDYDFLLNHKDFYPIIAMGDTEKYIKHWFDYYTLNQVKELVEFKTKSCQVNNEETGYLDISVKQEIDKFIDEASSHIYQILREVVA